MKKGLVLAAFSLLLIWPLACDHPCPVQTDVVYAGELPETGTETECGTETESGTETETETETETGTETESETETETETEIIELPPPLIWMTLADGDGHALTADDDGFVPAWNGQADRRPVAVTVHVKDESFCMAGAAGSCSLEISWDGQKTPDLWTGSENVLSWTRAGETERTWTLQLPADHAYHICADYENAAGVHPKLALDQNLVIDRTPPVAQISLEGGRRLFGKGDQITCSIKANDEPTVREASLTHLQVMAVPSDNSKPDILLYEADQIPLSGGAFETGLTVDADGFSDGTYQLKVTASDRMGYRGEILSAPFEIDTRPPQLDMTVTGGLETGGRYGRGPVTVRLTYTDAHPDPARRPGIDAGGMPWDFSGWQTVSGGLAGQIRLTAEGSYNLTVTAADAAGNSSQLRLPDPFVIDDTPPLILVSDGWRTWYRQMPEHPPLTVSDVNLIQETIRVWTRRRADGTDVPYAPGLSDGWYMLKAAALDAAGNEGDFARAFAVNRTGSVYRPSESDRLLLEGGIMAWPRQVSIIETNLSPVTGQVIRLSHAGQIRELTRGQDYTLRETGTGEESRQIIYILNAGCFQEEGLYMLHFSSTDAAGNENISQQKGTFFSFVADYTAPGLHGVDIVDGETYDGGSHTFTVIASSPDTVCLRYYLDDILVGTFDAPDLAENHGVFVFTLHEDGAAHSLRFEAEDKAGHKAAPLNYRISVGNRGEEETVPAAEEESRQEPILEAKGYEKETENVSDQDLTGTAQDPEAAETVFSAVSETQPDTEPGGKEQKLSPGLILVLILSVLLLMTPLIIISKRRR